MSNILQPLQGIELVDGNDTTTTELPIEEVSSVGVSPSAKDAEWVEVSNSTEVDKVVNEATTTEMVTTDATVMLVRENVTNTIKQTEEPTTPSSSTGELKPASSFNWS